jgi:hypothetical protein
VVVVIHKLNLPDIEGKSMRRCEVRANGPVAVKARSAPVKDGDHRAGLPGFIPFIRGSFLRVMPDLSG